MSLAGKPPFATDEPDSFYESSPTPRRNPLPKPEDPNKRTSAYNMYDNYLDDSDKALSPPASQANRISGVSNLGMGLLNMADDSDDDDSEDEAEQRRRRVTAASPSKNAALAVATQSSPPPRQQPSPTQQQRPPQQQQQQRSPPPQQRRPPQQQQGPPQQQQQGPPQQRMQGPPQQQQQGPPQQQQRPPPQQQQRPPQQQLRPPQQPPPGLQQPPQQQPPRPPPQNHPNQPLQRPNQPQQPNQPLPPIAAPRPGYAAPIAALNLARPDQAASPQGRLPPTSNPFEPTPRMFPTSPSPSTPHPLQPPMTPIKPVFALPCASPSITFDAPPTPRKPIIRGNSEETLLPNRGEKGDDFWRRFSMIAKEESRKPSAMKQSSWLRKNQSGSSRLNRWVGVVAVLLLLCIGAAVGLGIYLNRNAPAHQQPKVIGGSADELGSSVSPTSSSMHSSSTRPATMSTSSSLHVSPTHTVARRYVPIVGPTLAPRMYRRKEDIAMY